MSMRPLPVGLLFSSSLLLLLGLLAGNMALAMLAVAIMVYLIVTLVEGGTQARALPAEADTVVGEVGKPVTVTRRLEASGSPAVIVVSDELGDRFSSRTGKAISVLWKGRGDTDLKGRHQVVPVRQGRHKMGPMRVKVWNANALEEAFEVLPGDPVYVKTESRRKDMRALRNRRSVMILPMPVGHLSTMGAETTDFKEIREYRRGEGFRRVNWKASARRQRDGDFKPYVNDYEREGRRKVWLFLDCGRHMNVGTEEENALEHAGNLARTLSDLYLAADCLVGLVLFHAEGMLLPDNGRRQKALIARTLYGLDPGSSPSTMIGMVRKLKGHLRGGSPLYLVITSISEANASTLSSDLKELKGIGGKRSKVIVLNVRSYELSTRDELERMAARFMHLDQTIEVDKLRRDGWVVVDWDPREQSPAHVVHRMSEAGL